MASVFEQAISILQKRMKLSKADTEKIAELQAQASGAEFAAFGDIWEGVALTIYHPNYKGDAYIPDETIIPKDQIIEKFSADI